MNKQWTLMTAAMLASAMGASAAIMTSDDFSGTSLGAQWTAYPAGVNSPVSVSGGKLSTTIDYRDGSYIATTVASTTGYTLPTGNFSVQIDETKGTSNGWYESCFIQVTIGSNNYQLGKQWQSGSTGVVYSDGNPWGPTAVNMNFNDMQFKITRVDTTLSYYAKALADTTWTAIGTPVTVSTADATFSLGVINASGNAVTSYWDNFVVVPEPASLALLGLGAAGLLRRRR